MKEEQKVHEICRLLGRNRLVFDVNRKLSSGDSIIHAMIRYRSKDLQLVGLVEYETCGHGRRSHMSL